MIYLPYLLGQMIPRKMEDKEFNEINIHKFPNGRGNKSYIKLFNVELESYRDTTNLFKTRPIKKPTQNPNIWKFFLEQKLAPDSALQKKL